METGSTFLTKTLETSPTGEPWNKENLSGLAVAPLTAPAKKIGCVKVTRPDSHAGLWCLSKLAGFDLAAEFDGCEVGETITIEYVLMTQDEIDALPEFEGW